VGGGGDGAREFVDVGPAQAIVLAAIRPAPVVTWPLERAVGRTLADDVVMDIDDPPFDRAVMDGFAVRAADVARAPCELSVVGEIAAGAAGSPAVASGTAVRINTGAAMPADADAVVPIEQVDVTPDGTRVRVREPVSAGAHVTPRAKHAAAGQTLLRAGMPLTPARIAVAAAAGAVTVDVFAPTTVAILSTGDELVDVHARPQGAQIRNSNGFLLEALVRQAGAEPRRLGIVPDDKQQIAARVRDGLRSDFLLISGGISMGTFDLVPRVLERCGVRIAVRKMAIKPGRPTLFGISEFRAQSSESRVQSSNSRAQSSESRVQSSNSRVQSSESRVQSSNSRVQSSDARVQSPESERASLGTGGGGHQCAVFALPGNPVSAFMGFWLLVRPALAARERRPAAVQPTVCARLDGQIKPTAERRSYWPARLAPDESGRLTVRPTVWHGSGDPFGLIDANALIMRPPHAPAAQSGDLVDVLILDAV